MKEKHNPELLEERVNQIIAEMDWQKIHTVMEFLGWKWANTTGLDVPDVDQIKRAATTILKDCCAEGVIATRSGGFHARRFGNGLELMFVIDWMEQPFV